MSKHSYIAIVCLAGCLFFAAKRVCADDSATRPPDFQSGGSFEWYDEESGKLRSDLVPKIPSDDPANRDSRWETNLKNKKKRKLRPRKSEDSLLLNALAWSVVILLTLGVVVAMAWGLLRSDDEEPVSEGVVEVDQETEAERVERLPFQIQAAQTDLLGEVQLHAENGKYEQATIYLYSFMLVELDKFQVIRLEPGKTNGMYLRDVQAYPPLSATLSETAGAFEDAFFGNHPISRERFESCWSQLPAFQQYLQPTQGGQV